MSDSAKQPMASPSQADLLHSGSYISLPTTGDNLLYLFPPYSSPQFWLKRAKAQGRNFALPDKFRQ